MHYPVIFSTITLIVELLSFSKAFKYYCNGRRNNEPPCQFYIDMDSYEFRTKFLYSLNPYTRKGLVYYYNTQSSDKRKLGKMMIDYVDMHFAPQLVKPICHSFCLSYRHPTKIILYSSQLSRKKIPLSTVNLTAPAYIFCGRRRYWNNFKNVFRRTKN
uniref:Uncharacterized protein n=1 Tax=Strongyloides venezuelensis TaxID=75913 RepID=A0A0K0FXC7_STRVS